MERNECCESFLDQPMSPDAKGNRALMWHLNGMTTEQRQAYRDEMLSTTRDDFAEFGKRLEGRPQKVAVFGSADAIGSPRRTRRAARTEPISVTTLG